MRLSNKVGISIEVSMSPNARPLSQRHVIRGEAGAFVKLNLFRMVPSGPHNYLSSPFISLDANGEHVLLNEGPSPDGLYLAEMQYVSPPSDGRIVIEFNDPLVDSQSAVPIIMEGGEGRAPDDPANCVAAALSAQSDFREREIRAEGFSGDHRIIFHVLVGDCLLDYPQVFEGGHLQPLAHMLGSDDIVRVLKDILPDGSLLTPEQHRGRPLCLVTFINVQAEDVRSAAVAVSTPLQRIYAALAIDRAANPYPIASYARLPDGSYQLSLPDNAYWGNLLSGLGPGVTSLLDRINQAANVDPWIDFATVLLNSLRRQSNAEARLFQAWSLLEAAAKRRVASDPQVTITGHDGQPLFIGKRPVDQSQGFGRVIVYLRDYVARGRLGFPLSPTQPAFYFASRALYDGRNMIGHEGGISPPGRPAELPPISELAGTAHQWAELILQFEIDLATGPRA